MHLTIEENVAHLYIKALKKYAGLRVKPDDVKQRIYSEIADLTGYFWEVYEKRGSRFAMYMYESYLRLEDDLETLYGNGFSYKMLLAKNSNESRTFSKQ
ncbi:MAG: hypothetical protein ABIJ34_02620 [archaeon]